MHAAAAEAAPTGPAVDRILAIKLADLGDALTATPALRALRQTWRSATIDVLTSPAGAAALDGLDSVDRLWIADKHRFDSPAGLAALPALVPLLSMLRRQRYDQLLLFHHLTTTFGVLKYAALVRAIAARRTVGLDNGRGGFLDVRVPDEGFGHMHEADCNRAVAFAAGARPPSEPGRGTNLAWLPGVDAVQLRAAPAAKASPALAGLRGAAEPRLEIALDQASQACAVELLPGDPWIAIHAGGGTYSLARRWPAEGFVEVGRRLMDATGCRLVLIGTDADREPHELLARQLDVLDLTGRTSVKETAAVLARCRLLVANDSGVVHLATAVGTPVVAIFGPSNDRAWGPYPPARHRVVRASLPCSPCFYHGKRLGTPEGCPTRDCLQLVTPSMVVAAAQDLLAPVAA